ncbi:hypothetical protein BJ912DRAFT_922365 [Pholiota molesta]|nr:hypothetical protein BJ912DRAFT_922365 [Pholiota molesta]
MPTISALSRSRALRRKKRIVLAGAKRAIRELGEGIPRDGSFLIVRHTEKTTTAPPGFSRGQQTGNIISALSISLSTASMNRPGAAGATHTGSILAILSIAIVLWCGSDPWTVIQVEDSAQALGIRPWDALECMVRYECYGLGRYVCAHTEKAMGCIAICGLLQVACTICVGVLCVHARTEGMSGIWDARSATGKGARAQAHNRVDYLCLECCNLGRYVRLHAAGPKWDAWARTRVPTCAWRNTAAIPYWVGPRHHPNEEEAGHRLTFGPGERSTSTNARQSTMALA